MKRRRRTPPTNPLLGAIVTFFATALLASLIARIFFEDAPDIQLIPLVYLGPLLFAANTYYVQLQRRRAFAGPIPGHCRSCAYDLNGNTSGVCPECGTVVAKGAV